MARYYLNKILKVGSYHHQNHQPAAPLQGILWRWASAKTMIALLMCIAMKIYECTSRGRCGRGSPMRSERKAGRRHRSGPRPSRPRGGESRPQHSQRLNITYLNITFLYLFQPNLTQTEPNITKPNQNLI